ncbi:hypothetical protein BSL78_17335 [Apostichopus japonicus]|uniref:DED domain-containing protein n=1 Tax=Stichopus japonicus TaxID=307972 RepID=A0A2G8KCT7_STIJA|nr:hypothetical protein BSL78_17335 [Apostichopus japonicus]
MAKLSDEVAAEVVSISDDIKKKELEDILQYLVLREILTVKQQEEIHKFSKLVETLLDLEEISASHLQPLVDYLFKIAKRKDLASKLESHVTSADSTTENSKGNEQEIEGKLRQELTQAYVAFTNIFLNPEKCDVDDIFCPVQLNLSKRQNRKETLSSHVELFNLEKKTRVILKGKTASGKSTLLKKITKDWVNGKLPQYDFVIVLFTGQLKPEWTIGQAVVQCLLSKDCQISPQQVDMILSKKQEKVAILFDAYEADMFTVTSDEPKSPSPLLLLSEILTYKLLRETFVLLATRLQSARELCNQAGDLYAAYQHVEMGGFKAETMEHFVKANVSTEEKQGSLLRYLETNNLKAMACTPGFLHMLCKYWNIQNSPAPPEMLNSLFHNMLYALFDHSRGSGDNQNRQCQFGSMMLCIGQKAFMAILNGKEVFSLNMFKDGKNDEQVMNCLKFGLLKHEDSFKYQKPFHCISNARSKPFPIQEESQEEEEEEEEMEDVLSPLDALVSFHSNHIHCYCAGLYLRELAKTNFSSFQKKLKKLFKAVDRLFENKNIYVFLFCFSIAGEKDGRSKLNTEIGRFMLKQMAQVIEKAESKLQLHPDLTTEMQVYEIRNHYTKLCLHCNYEAQVKSALNAEMVKCIKGHNITLVGLSEYTARALQYYLKHSRSGEPANQFQLESLKIITLGNEVNIACLKEFSKNVPGGMDFFRSSMEMCMAMDKEELQAFIKTKEEQLKKVNYAEDLCDVKKGALLDYYCDIRSWNPHTNVVLPVIESVIKYQLETLKELRLTIQDINTETWMKLFEAIKGGKLKTLKILDLSFCELGKHQLRVLSLCFLNSKKVLPNLKELALSGVRCSDAAIQKLMHLTTLESLTLQNCCLTEKQMFVVFDSVKTMKGLKKLDLRRNEFSSDNAFEFDMVLKELNLEELKLSLNKAEKHISKLLIGIKEQKSLKILHLNHCPVPLDLLRSCKDVPCELPKLLDFRLSASLPRFKSRNPPQLPKIKPAQETMNTFIKNLKTLKNLETFSLLYCELDASHFMNLRSACQYLKTNYKLKLMR